MYGQICAVTATSPLLPGHRDGKMLLIIMRQISISEVLKWSKKMCMLELMRCGKDLLNTSRTFLIRKLIPQRLMSQNNEEERKVIH